MVFGKNTSFNYFSTGNDHLFALLTGRNLLTSLERRKLLDVGGKTIILFPSCISKDLFIVILLKVYSGDVLNPEKVPFL